VQRIDRLLNHDGYTIRGVQQLLAAEGKTSHRATSPLTAVRDMIARALADDRG
jgi:hypothetical protein